MTEQFKPALSFRVSPDKKQSKYWINIKLYTSLDTIKEMQGGTEYLDAVVAKMKRNPGGVGDTIVGFFEPPHEKFKPNTKGGQCAGTIVMIDDPGINIISHEATHAGHCYASYAMAAIQKSGRLSKNEMYTWYEEALATCVESVVSEITKKLGYRNSITRVNQRTKKIVRPE